jgi:hypothetical protein
MATNLAKIVRAAAPGSGVQLRPEPYGKNGIRQFLRDVVAMANASVDGNRYIIIGAEIDKKGGKRLTSVSLDDFSGKPSYQALVSDYIEPPIRIKYQPASVDGKRVGVFEIGDCQDRPYMMRVDFSEKLRRGDAYIRVDDAAIKMGRRILQDMFERKFRDSVSAERVEVGFPGEIIHKDFRIKTIDLAQLPSAIASAKLKQLLDIQNSVKNSGSTTVMARLTHARLFGSDSPYENRSADELMAEMAEIERKYRNDDEHFMFEVNAEKLQIVVYNQGDEPIQDASLSILMPNHNAFFVANKLPKLRRNGEFVDRSGGDSSEYPTVNLKDDAIHISNTLGEIPTYAPVNAFDVPLRICVGSELKGRRLGIRYSLFGSNLRTPAKGKLRLLF